MRKPFLLLSLLIFLGLFGVFYYKYVPLVWAFQACLIPLLILMAVLAAVNIRWGILAFVLAIPIVNVLPYFFAPLSGVAYAPIILILFLAFFFGWLFRQFFLTEKYAADLKLFPPMTLFAGVVLVSGIITVLRFLDFYPFLSPEMRDLFVNVFGVRSGGAVMSTVFSFLSYVTGFLFFLFLYNVAKTKEFQKKLLLVLSAATILACAFALIQKYHSLEFGNKTFFVNMNRVNGTFIDPNSFGLFVAAFVPVLIGMFFSFKRPIKYYFLGVILLSLFVFPFIGSRSGALGLIAALVVFVGLLFRTSKMPFKRKMMLLTAVLVIVVIVLVVLVSVSKGTNLYQRLAQDFKFLSQKAPLSFIIDVGRFEFWQISKEMITDFPLTGVGLGAFIVDLPNYALIIGRDHPHTDSAENYFLQIFSELGLIGLVLILWLLFEIFRMIWLSWKNLDQEDSDKYILIGLISGLVAVFINLFFHSYIGAFDVNYSVWLLIAMVCVFGFKVKRIQGEKKQRGLFRMAALLVLLIFGGIHLWNSLNSLSIAYATERFGLEQNFGLYATETDEYGNRFNWTRKKAGISVLNKQQILVMPIRAAHPGIEDHVVTVKVYRADAVFKNEEFVKELKLQNMDWTEFVYDLSDYTGNRFYLVFETDREWQPQKFLGTADTRWLAIAIGEPRSR